MFLLITHVLNYLTYLIAYNFRYIGMYQGTLPTLLIRDPEIIKEVTVKEFDHFLNHRLFVPDGVDALWSRNLVALKGISSLKVYSVYRLNDIRC